MKIFTCLPQEQNTNYVKISKKGSCEKPYAKYTTFSVASEAEKYKLTVGGYSGTAGIKCLLFIWKGKYLSIYLSMKFSLYVSLAISGSLYIIADLVLIFKTIYIFLQNCIPGDSLSHHNGKKFTTKDQDNGTYDKNCAVPFQSGWWFTDCFLSNLNGLKLNFLVHFRKNSFKKCQNDD